MSETKPLIAEQPRKSMEEIVGSNTMEAQDPDQLELHAEGEGQEAATDSKTILRPDIERELEQHQPQTLSLMQTVMGMIAQQGIVVFATLLAIYEMVFKPKANNAMAAGGWGFKIVGKEEDGKIKFEDNMLVSSATFETASIPLMAALLAIVVGFALAAKNGQVGMIFTKEHAKICLLFQPAAVGFALSQFLGFFSLEFLTPDSLKVFDQSRLLVTAVVMSLLLRKRFSRGTWTALGVITIAAIMYGMVKTLEAGKGGGGDPNIMVGALLVLVNATITALAGVWAEKFMKQYKHVPFYIQKIYLEVGNVVIQSLCFFVFNIMKSGGKKPNNANNFGYNPLHGWFSNPYVILLFINFFTKSYLQGILVKRMSSLVKQLTAVVATALCYFFAIIHTAQCDVKGFSKPILENCYNNQNAAGKQLFRDAFKDIKSTAARNQMLEQCRATAGTVVPTLEEMTSHTNQFFCFKADVSPYMVLADVLVLAAVLSYIFANRDKARKQMYRKERDDLAAQLGKTAEKV